MIDWSRGYAAHWKAYEVDLDTWADGEQIDGVISASIERDVSSESSLIESGSITIDVPNWYQFDEKYVRIAMVAEQDASYDRVDVCTLLCSCSSGDINRRVDSINIDGRSVLWPASVAKLERGDYVPSGYDCVAWCRELLTGCLAAPVVSYGSFTLNEPYVIDIGSSVLEAVWLVLEAGGWCMRIEGSGMVIIEPLPTEPALDLDSAGARLLIPGVHHELDWSEVPNRYIATDGVSIATAVNNEPGSPTSIMARGYRHDEFDSSPTLVGGEDLEEYAERRLEEMSTVHDTRSYAREWWPDVTCFSIVRGSIPSIGLDGDLRVERQSLECGHGIRVTEQAYKEVIAWRR